LEDDLIFNEEDVKGLDDLLDMSGDDSGKAEDTPNEPESIEIVGYPHFKISTKKFLDVLKISALVSQGSSKTDVCKAIGMEVKGSELQVYMTDFETYVERSIEILNTEDVLTDFISVNFQIISKLVQACPSTMTVYKKDEKYFIKLIGGDMELELVKTEKSQLLLKNKSKFMGAGELETLEFKKIIKGMFVLANAAVTASQKRIFFADNLALSTRNVACFAFMV
jgi:DNA polymerase III sliding clamp (beta) subunit (PCNA family)